VRRVAAHLEREEYAVSSFTRVNLMEIEPSGTNPEVQSRFGRSSLNSEHLGVSLFRYAPGFHNPHGHSHREQEEAYVVVSGSGRAKLDDEIIELALWDVVRVAPQTVRAFEAGPDGLDLLAVGSDRPEGGDGAMERDWWTD
jgi:quercetin dioxygenase-like cupin family protein